MFYVNYLVGLMRKLIFCFPPKTYFQFAAPYPSTSSKTAQLNRLVVRMIAKDLQPMSVVEDEGFRELIKGLDPRFTLPSRSLIREKLLPGNFLLTNK